MICNSIKLLTVALKLHISTGPIEWVHVMFHRGAAWILCSKISYLLRICNDQDSTLKSQVFNAIAATDVHSLDLVKQCKFLESHIDSLKNLTEEVLSNSTELCTRSVRERILSADRLNVLSSSKGHPSLLYPSKIARIWVQQRVGELAWVHKPIPIHLHVHMYMHTSTCSCGGIGG